MTGPSYRNGGPTHGWVIVYEKESGGCWGTEHAKDAERNETFAKLSRQRKLRRRTEAVENCRQNSLLALDTERLGHSKEDNHTSYRAQFSLYPPALPGRCGTSRVRLTAVSTKEVFSMSNSFRLAFDVAIIGEKHHHFCDYAIRHS